MPGNPKQEATFGRRKPGMDYSITPREEIPFSDDMLDRALWAHHHEMETIERIMNGSAEEHIGIHDQEA